MNPMDLMRALDAVLEADLHEAENYARSARPRRLLPRIAAIAATVALLCGTVYAAFSGVTLHLNEKNTGYWFQDFEYEGIQYSKVTFEYQLSAVQVKETAVDFLESMIAPCDRWVLDENRLIPAMNYHSHTFAELSMAENFFGVTFALPDVVWEAKPDSREVTLDAEAMYGPEAEPRHEGYDFVYDADLGGASLDSSMAPKDDRFSSIYVGIYLALTEEFADVPYDASFFYPLEVYGEPLIQEVRLGDQDFTLLSFPNCPGSDVDVFYIRDGIGYLLSFTLADDFTGDPLDAVRSCLKTLE